MAVQISAALDKGPHKEERKFVGHQHLGKKSWMWEPQ